MTRGWYVMIRKNGEIVPVQSNGSSYMEWLGKRILQHFAGGHLSVFIEDEHAEQMEMYGREEDDTHLEVLQNFNFSWIFDKPKDPEKKSYDYAEYGYIYDEKKDTLTVYHYGDKLFTAKRVDAEKWLYVAEYASQLESALEYNAEKLSFSILKAKAYRKLSAMSLDEVKAMVAELDFRRLEGYQDYPRLEGFDHHVISKRHTSWSPSYSKLFSMNGEHVEFLLEKTFPDKWILLIRLPWCVANTGIGEFSSEKAADKALRVFCRENMTQLCEFAKKYGEVEKFLKEVVEPMQLFNADRCWKELTVFADKLDKNFEENPWLTLQTGGSVPYFSPRNIRDRLTWEYQIRLKSLRDARKRYDETFGEKKA